MENLQEIRYVKRTQKDYTMSFKLQVVQEIERGELSTHSACRKYGIQSRSTIVQWLRKFGNFDWENQTPSNMGKSPEQKIMELEAQVKLLEKQKAFLEQQAFVAEKKAIIFDGIHYLHVFVWLMTKNYDKLADNLVNIDNKTFSSKEEAIELMKERTKK